MLWTHNTTNSKAGVQQRTSLHIILLSGYISHSLPLKTNSTFWFPKGLFGPPFSIKFSTLECAALSAIHGTFVHESHIRALLKMVYIRRQCTIYYQSFYATSTTPLIRFTFTSKHCVHEWIQKSFNTKNASHAFPPYSALPIANLFNEIALSSMTLSPIRLSTQMDSSPWSAKHQTNHHWAIYARCSCWLWQCLIFFLNNYRFQYIICDYNMMVIFDAPNRYNHSHPSRGSPDWSPPTL